MQHSKRRLLAATATALLAAASRVRAHGDEAHAQTTGPARKEQKDWGIAGDAGQATRRVKFQHVAHVQALVMLHGGDGDG